MGPGIALSFALGGFEVVLSGRSEHRLASELAGLERAAGEMIEYKLLDADAWHNARGRIQGEVALGPASSRCTYVVEAIIEDLSAKQTLLQELEELLGPEALLASTTSSLSPSDLQSGLINPQRVLVTHYIQPAQLMPVVEVAPGRKTAPEAVERASRVIERCGLRPVFCRDVPGFLFNRLQYAILREAVALLGDGVATAEDIDTVLKVAYAARLPGLGPFEHADLVGLDLVETIAKTIWSDLDCASDPEPGLIGELVAQGQLGMKAGRGFHDWRDRDPSAFKQQRDLAIIRRLQALNDEGRGEARERR
jgi:3-hydroxybutyryl-CoA dehydrogenase